LSERKGQAMMSSHPITAVLIGAGGHAKVIADILAPRTDLELIGCTDHRASGKLLHLDILGDDSLLPLLFERNIRHTFVAIGDNRLRLRIAAYAASIGFQFIQAVSRSAYVSPSALLGQGVAVMPGAVIQPEVHIGDHSIINTGASVDHECRIGKGCHIAPGANLAGLVTVGDGSFLGTGVKVIPGVKIGKSCIIGAGTVVIRDIPDYSRAVGVPARLLNPSGTSGASLAEKYKEGIADE
jgi:UDP-perosamine 4-acetyltransferase